MYGKFEDSFEEKHKKKDGRIPLALRISENYKTNYVWLGHSIF